MLLPKLLPKLAKALAKALAGTQMTGGTAGAENVNIPSKKRIVLSTFQQAVQNEAMGELRDALGELRDALGEPDAARSMVTVCMCDCLSSCVFIC